MVFGSVNFPDAFLLLRLNEIGFSVVEVILAYVAYNAVYAVTSYPAGLVADRIGRPAVFGIGLVFFAVGYIGLGLTTDTVTAWLLIGVYGVFTGCTDGVGKAWVSSLVGPDLQGSARACSKVQRFRSDGGGVVGRVRLGCRRSAAAVDLRDHRRRGRGRRARDRDGRALPGPDVDFEVIERERWCADAGHRIATLRCALGDAGFGADFTDGQDHLLR